MFYLISCFFLATKWHGGTKFLKRSLVDEMAAVADLCVVVLDLVQRILGQLQSEAV